MDLTELIESQDQIIARWQARALGMPADTIDYRLRHSIWRTVYPGVYSTVTGALTRGAQLWAAILVCSKEVVLSRGAPGPPHKPDAALSHETAAYLHGLADKDPGLIHLTIPTARRIPVASPSIRVHMSIRLDETRHPALEPPRTALVPTVVDLSQTAQSTDHAISWLTRACGKRLTTPDQLLVALAARKKLRRRRELVEALGDTSIGSHSILELRYLRDVERAHGLPEGRRQRRRITHGTITYEDVVYEEFDTTVELDGRLGHEYEGVFRDRRRDNATVERGGAPLRYGHTDIESAPCASALQVIAVLKHRGWTGTPFPCKRPNCVVRHR